MAKKVNRGDKMKEIPGSKAHRREAPQVEPDEPDKPDRVQAVSVALYESEFYALQDYANEHHASRGSLLSALVRHAWREVRAGRLKPDTKGLKFKSDKLTN
jgi:hypothetical protein